MNILRQADPAQLGLEDEYTDVLNKSRRGLGLDFDALARRADLPLTVVEAVYAGEDKSDAALEKLAAALNLHGPSLTAMAHGRWRPAPVPPMPGLAMFTTWYGDSSYGEMTVNAFLIWDPATRLAASFDTGANCEPMLDCIASKRLRMTRIFITHTHGDHRADLARLCDTFPEATAYGSAAENPLGLVPLSHGDALDLGGLSIDVLGTSGHTPGGLSFYVRGLQTPVVVVGDALFASSMGGAPEAYQEALANNQNHLLTLPPETIVCPGHGVMTTVGEERKHNPFFPDLK